MASRYMALATATSGSVGGAAQGAIETRQSNALSMMKIDIDLLKASGCKIPADAITPDRYEPEANGCKLRLIVGRFAESGSDKACDATQWRGLKKP